MNKGKSCSGNLTIDERWGREYKPLPFAAILQKHLKVSPNDVENDVYDLPSPLSRLIGVNVHDYTEARSSCSICEWGHLPFQDLFDTQRIKNANAKGTSVNHVTRKYLASLPQYTAKYHNDLSTISDSEEKLFGSASSRDGSKYSYGYVDLKTLSETEKFQRNVGSLSSSDGGTSIYDRFDDFEYHGNDIYIQRGFPIDYCHESDKDSGFIYNAIMSDKSVSELETIDDTFFKSCTKLGSSSKEKFESKEIVASPIKRSKIRERNGIADDKYAVDKKRDNADIQYPANTHLTLSSQRPNRTLSFQESDAVSDKKYLSESLGSRDRDSLRMNELPTRNSGTREYHERAQTNPFRREDGINYINARTHNRRRWSYVFPAGKLAQTLTFYGLNWKSLSQPAVLPISIDYFPSVQDLHTNYDVTFYDIIIDKDCYFDTFENVLVEMVCQRLSMVMLKLHLL